MCNEYFGILFIISMVVVYTFGDDEINEHLSFYFGTE